MYMTSTNFSTILHRLTLSGEASLCSSGSGVTLHYFFTSLSSVTVVSGGRSSIPVVSGGGRGSCRVDWCRYYLYEYSILSVIPGLCYSEL